MSLLVIPDIHGQRTALEAVLNRADARFGTGARIVFLGDLVDRGPDSRGVIQTLMDGIAAGRDWVVLRGNHDQMFLDALMDVAGGRVPEIGPRWLSANIGGVETLRSYGLAPPVGTQDWAEVTKAVPETHRRFLESLPLQHETDLLFFAHAGIRPGIPLDAQDPDDLIWIREPFLSDRRNHGKLVIHGHTAIKHPENRGNRVNLDGGAGYGRTLHLARIEGRNVSLVTTRGEVPLAP